MMNYFYVALTRSKSELTILITEAVDNSFGTSYITNWYSQIVSKLS